MEKAFVFVVCGWNGVDTGKDSRVVLYEITSRMAFDTFQDNRRRHVWEQHWIGDPICRQQR